MNEATYRLSLGEFAAAQFDEFVASGGKSLAPDAGYQIAEENLVRLADALSAAEGCDNEAIPFVRFLFEACRTGRDSTPLFKITGVYTDEVVRLLEEPVHRSFLDSVVKSGLFYYRNWVEAEKADAGFPFQSPLANLIWRHGDFGSVLLLHMETVASLVRYRPESIRASLGKSIDHQFLFHFNVDPYRRLIAITAVFDDEVAEFLLRELGRITAETTSGTMEGYVRRDLFLALQLLVSVRDGPWKHRFKKLASSPDFAAMEPSVEFLLSECADEVLKILLAARLGNAPYRAGAAYRELIARAYDDFAGDGGRYLRKVLAEGRFRHRLCPDTHTVLLADPQHRFAEQVREFYLAYAATLKGKQLADFWEAIEPADAGLFEKEWREMASAKGQQLRSIGARWLATKGGADLAKLGREMASSTSVDDRIGGATLLAEAGDPASIDRLKELHATETSKQVREELAKLLEKCGHAVAAEPKKPVATFASFADFEQSLSGKAKGIRLPTAPWLNAAKLSALHTRQGDEVGELVRTFLFQRQARERGGVVSEEVEPLLAHLDRSKNAAFAHALLDQWFGSDMKASSRWALDVAGLTGDDTIIDRLVQPIPQWCKQNAGKRAEWAVHAIALIGSPAALRMLDALTHRYRSQRKYVGAAASEAIRTLASVQGISEDEIAERIVPDFGFDATCQRIFPSKSGGTITAKLRPDFKIVWQSGDDKETATAPTGLTTADETEAKGMAKLLREALKSQKLRLEKAMVEGRRWPVETWQERFEKHPLFRLLAESLVWAVHDPDGMMLRTFRRYPNGILADANGEPEEFEGASSVGLPHPVNLDEATLAAWGAHLKRFKVKSPLSQIERPVERPDALHGNRRELRLAEGKELDAAELRSRIIGQGWTLGSTRDGGYIYDCFRKFQSLQLEAYLALEDFHAMSGRGDVVKTGSALIARSDPDRKRSHLGTMPEPDDPRVQRFDQVPAVVWSETMSDLKAIIGT